MRTGAVNDRGLDFYRRLVDRLLELGAVGAIVNFVVAFLVDKVTKEPPAHIQAMVEAVRIPRGSRAVDGAH